jgi:hypothetical protein
LETELNLDPELITDLDPNLQIISDPSGSGCTTLQVLRTKCEKSEEKKVENVTKQKAEERKKEKGKLKLERSGGK